MVKRNTTLFQNINKDLIPHALSAISMLQLCVETSAGSLMDRITFSDFMKLSIVISVKKGNPAIFRAFWTRVCAA